MCCCQSSSKMSDDVTDEWWCDRWVMMWVLSDVLHLWDCTFFRKSELHWTTDCPTILCSQPAWILNSPISEHLRHTHAHARTHSRMHTLIHKRTHTHTHKCCTFTHVNTHKHMHTHIHTHTWIQTYTNTYTHTISPLADYTQPSNSSTVFPSQISTWSGFGYRTWKR